MVRLSEKQAAEPPRVLTWQKERPLWFILEMIGECHTDVAETFVEDVEIVADIKSHHRAIVNTEGQGTGFQLESKTQCGSGTEEETVATVFAVVESNAATKTTPEFPSGELRCPVGPLLDVPIVDGLSGKSIVEVEHACRDIKEVLLAEVILILEVDGRSTEVCTDGVRSFLGMGSPHGGDGQDEAENHLFHKAGRL